MTLHIAFRAIMQSDNMAKVFITGGGFVGRLLAGKLADAGHDIHIYTRSENYDLAELRGRYSGEVELCIGDLGDMGFLRDTVRQFRPDIVIHTAAHTKYNPESDEDEEGFFFRNVEYTRKILNVCVELEIWRFILSSSVAVYGVPQNDEGIVDEEDEPAPLTAYARSKLESERVLRDFAGWLDDLRYITMRYGNIAGADEFTKACEVAAENNDTGGSIFLLEDYPTEDGSLVRDYIHPDDLVQAHARAVEYLMETPARPSLLLNCGSGKGISYKAIRRQVEDYTGRKITIDNSNAPRNPIPALICNCKRIREVFGWRAKRKL